MNLVSLIDYLRERLKLVITLGCVALGLIALADVLRWFLARGHAAAAPAHAAPAAATAGAHGAEHASGFLSGLYHIAETVPVFWSVFGFVACVLIVILSKAFGHLKVGPNTEIMTREDYYNE